MSSFSFSRRALLAALAAARSAFALGDASRLTFAVAEHGGRWNVRESGLRRVMSELERRTSLEVSLEGAPLKLDDPRLFEFPFLYFTGDGEFPALKASEVENLRRFLTFGGFLFADAADGSDAAGFDLSFRREIARVLPRNPLTPVPLKHVLFKTFYLLDTTPGRVLNKAELNACFISKRATVMYSQNDVFGALSRDTAGGFEFDVVPGGEHQRELATRLAVNIVMYALCLDYKDDAVHLPIIMGRRR